MTTREIVKLILAFADEYSAGAAISRLSVVSGILEGTSSYMHDDIIKAAFGTKKEGENEREPLGV